MKTIYLIRHGETSHNWVNKRFSGITDVHMTEKGVEQCRSLSGFFDDKNIEEVYVSPLTRAVDSAKNIFPSFQDSLITANDLIEMNYGDYEGLEKGALPHDDELIRKWNAGLENLTFPNGDNVRSHADRVYNGLVEIAKSSKASTIACVSHRTTIRLLIVKILQIDLKSFRKIPCFNCSVTKVEFDEEDGFNLITLNAALEWIART